MMLLLLLLRIQGGAIALSFPYQLTMTDGWQRKANTHLENEGVVVLRSAIELPKNIAEKAIKRVRDVVHDDLETLVESHDVISRGRRRFDIKVGDSVEWNRMKEIVEHYITEELLGSKMQVSGTGCVVSFPGAPEQMYHADGNVPFINAFIPLVHVEETNGPTEFAIGSHLDEHAVLRAPTLQYEDEDKSFRLVAPDVHRGDILLFDYRVLHRGLANRSKSPRPIFYATFSPPGTRDTVNFPVV